MSPPAKQPRHVVVRVTLVDKAAGETTGARVQILCTQTVHHVANRGSTLARPLASLQSVIRSEGSVTSAVFRSVLRAGSLFTCKLI